MPASCSAVVGRRGQKWRRREIPGRKSRTRVPGAHLFALRRGWWGGKWVLEVGAGGSRSVLPSRWGGVERGAGSAPSLASANASHLAASLEAAGFRGTVLGCSPPSSNPRMCKRWNECSHWNCVRMCFKIDSFFIPAPHPRPQSSFPLELLPKQQQGLCVVIYFGVGFLSSSSFLFKWGRA